MNNRMLRRILSGAALRRRTGMRSRGLLMLALLLLGAQTASAANKYLRVGATGSNNGTDWTNAYSSMGSVSFSGMGAGDTLFVAAGTYNGSMTVNVSGASGYLLNIKPAT